MIFKKILFALVILIGLAYFGFKKIEQKTVTQIHEKILKNDEDARQKMSELESISNEIASDPIFRLSTNPTVKLPQNIVGRVRLVEKKDKKTPKKCLEIRKEFEKNLLPHSAVDEWVDSGSRALDQESGKLNWTEVETTLEKIRNSSSTDWVTGITAETVLEVADLPGYKELAELHTDRISCLSRLELDSERLVMEAFARFVDLYRNHKEDEALSEARLVARLFFGGTDFDSVNSALSYVDKVSKFLVEVKKSDAFFNEGQIKRLVKFKVDTWEALDWGLHSTDFIDEVSSRLTPSTYFCALRVCELVDDRLLVQVSLEDPELLRLYLEVYRKGVEKCWNRDFIERFEVRAKELREEYLRNNHFLKRMWNKFGTVAARLYYLDPKKTGH